MFKYFNRIRNRVPNLGTDSREKGVKRVARDRSWSVVMNLTCFNKLIEYTNWCCLSVDIMLQSLKNRLGRGRQFGVFLRLTEVNET